MMREVSVSFSPGRPSRLKKPPGIFQPRKSFAVVNSQGEEIQFAAVIRSGGNGSQYNRIPIPHQGRAICLLGDFARFNG